MQDGLTRWARASLRLLNSSRTFRRLYAHISYDEVNRAMFANLREHDRMLADRVRVEAYERALRAHMKEGDIVIDLGTGSGILSLLAARSKPARIYALDHSNIIAIARAAARHNGVDCIQFECVSSREFSLDHRVDVIIHEQIGDFLFEENMVENVVDLRDRLLKPGGRILPNRFELFIEPVTLRDEFRIPFTWEHANLCGLDFRFVKEQMRDKLDGDYYFRTHGTYEVERFLCTPEPVLELDLETVKTRQLPRRLRYRREVQQDGRLDGFALYFRAIFDDRISFSNSPRERNTSWANRLLRVEARRLVAGRSIEFEIHLRDLSNPATWRWHASPC